MYATPKFFRENPWPNGLFFFPRAAWKKGDLGWCGRPKRGQCALWPTPATLLPLGGAWLNWWNSVALGKVRESLQGIFGIWKTESRGCRKITLDIFGNYPPQMVKGDLYNIAFQGLALIQGQIYNPVKVPWITLQSRQTKRVTSHLVIQPTFEFHRNENQKP